MQAVLAKIVADKAIWIKTRKKQQPLVSSQNEIQPSTRHFYDALQGARTVFVLECKKALPSEGAIRDDFDPARIVAIYKHYTSTISALVDERYFQGSSDFLPITSQIASQPISCKDFIISPYQIYPVRYYQADACLLVLSVLDDEQYRRLAAVAYSLEVGVLAGVSNKEELERAIILGAEIIGIDNRDLRGLSIDLNRTRRPAPKLGHSMTVISESDVNTYAQMRELSHLASGFLIGSALAAHDGLNAAVRWMLLGENKVCDLTHGQDAKAVYDVGAIHGGLIFIATSPRCVNVEQAQEVMAVAPLQYVGMFHNHDIVDVADKAKVLSLTAVQLHGSEDQLYIDNLCETLPAHTVIQKALSVSETLSVRDLQHIGKYVFDNGRDRSERRFDWPLLSGQSFDNVLLAGGLDADNCVEAAQTGCAGLDFNSVVESQPDIKSACLLASVFQTLRTY